MKIGETKTEVGHFQIFYKCDCPTLKPKFRYFGAGVPPIFDTRAFFEVCGTCGRLASEWQAVIGRYVTKIKRTGWFRKEQETTVEDVRPLSATPRKINMTFPQEPIISRNRRPQAG